MIRRKINFSNKNNIRQLINFLDKRINMINVKSIAKLVSYINSIKSIDRSTKHRPRSTSKRHINKILILPGLNRAIRLSPLEIGRRRTSISSRRRSRRRRRRRRGVHIRIGILMRYKLPAMIDGRFVAAIAKIGKSLVSRNRLS